ncbi:MAG: glycoside hydrolase family 18 protein [Imperialibacter sp.]|uniref:glycoside hydrolase family 18 protein n=1 Tax=Imperialibacter sp. TaxID=2038411 RepID=UPI0032EF36E1
MKRLTYCAFVLYGALAACSPKPVAETPAETTPPKKEIIGYVPGFRGLLDEKAIDANKLTIINYAFVDVKDSLAWLTNLETDSTNFRKLNYLKKDNPALKIVISIGGWSWSENFSDAVLTPSSREKFAKSGTKIVADYNLDGIDIDWEYPGLKGEDNVFRDEDKENFTLMFEAIRKELDALAVTTGKKYIVSTALPCFPRLFEVTNMGEVAKHIDFVNIMAYDFYVAGDTVGHHSNLYPSENYEKENSGDKAVKTYIEQGVPAEKLVLGVPFYGRSWTMKSSDNLGILRPRNEVMRGNGFTFIKDSLMANPGFVRYWDDAAKSPYLFNAENNQLVVYDDESSLKLKCEYVNDNGLAGIMFWQYASDPKEYLLDVVNENLD